MKTPLLIGLLFLIGCATPMDLAKRKPQIEYTSTKTPEELTACISQKWSENTSVVSTSPMKDGFTVWIANPYGGTPGIAWISKGDGGSNLKFSSQFESYCPKNICKPVSECQ